MGEEEQPKGPEIQKAPPPPTLAELTQQATAAQKNQFNELLPLMGQYAQEQANVQGRIAPQMLQQHVDQQRLFGPQLIGLAVDAAKQADPTGFTLNETLKQKALTGLQAGGGLDPVEQSRMTEDLRQAQANRGFGTGMNDAISEGQFLNSQRFAREQQRMQAALAALSGRGGVTDQINPSQITPKFGADTSISGQLFGQTGQMMGFGQNAWQQNANQVADFNRMNQAQWQFGVQNARNPLKEDIMFGLEVGKGVGQIAGGVMGAAMGNPMAGMSAVGGASNLAGTAQAGPGGFGGNYNNFYQPMRY
jgi:hypothetical protein